LSKRDLDDAVLANEIVEIHRASQGTYGSPRVHGQLRHRGRRVSRKRVARIMADCGLVGVHGRRRWRRGKAMVGTAPAPDLLGRDFTAQASDHKWVADITEFACWDGKLFLAGIKDLHDQSIVGWSMGTRQTTDLVVNALVMALGRRHRNDSDLIHHADRGSQYTSLEFSTRMADWSITPSFSRTGNCFDNAAMESTWATIKKELRHLHGPSSQMTRSQLRTALFAYIETFYNRNRHQARLGHRTPAEVYAASHAA
jgi:transposase InsO family protein